MNPLSRLASLILLVTLGVHAGAVLAQSYPSKPIRIVVGYAAGGSSDTIARLISPKMANSLSQPVLVENHVGAGGRIAQELVAKAAPDGYTILIDTPGFAVSPSLYRKLPFNTASDFIPVTQLVTTTMVLVAGPKLSGGSIRELIALAKSKPGSLNYGHPGIGASMQLAMELVNMSAGVDIVAIPYKGEALVGTALMAGDVDVAVMGLSTVLQSVKAGRLRALGVGGTRRSAALPDVPTFAEAGVDVEFIGWQGLFVAAKTPRGVVELIQREAAKALNMPDVRERMLGMGLEPVGSTPEEFDARFKGDMAKYARIIKQARIPVQD